MSEHKLKTSPRDFFLHLLSMVTLYASAISFTVIVFQSINIWIPDPLEYFSLENSKSAIRAALSFLIVMFPIYILTLKSLYKSYQADEQKRDLWVRKWLLYFTLFVAALIIIITTIILMNTFLDGELTLRFVYKLASVFYIAGAIFTHYFWDLKDKKWNDVKYFSYAVIVIIIVSIVVGFANAGLPSDERQRRLDDRIVSNLMNIQWGALEMYKSGESLPENLAEIKKDRGGDYYNAPRTEEEYVYNKIGDLTFELCANFETDYDGSDENNSRIPFYKDDILVEAPVWGHGIGEQCFIREIDQEKYANQFLNTPDFEVPFPVR